MKTLKEFLEAFQNENYKISIVNSNRVSSDEDYVLITTDKKYKDCIKDKILNSTVSGFAIPLPVPGGSVPSENHFSPPDRWQSPGSGFHLKNQ